jgi:hypothetical protein
MATVAAPVTTLLLQASLPDLVQSCVIAPPLEPSPVDDPDAPFAPLPPGVSLDDVAVIGEEQLIDTSPDQLIGCIIDTEDNPQGRLNALFPDAEAGDGVIERSTSHFWVYDGSEWTDVGPNPGPRLIITSILSPINEIFVVSAPTRTKIRVTALAYALQLLTEPDPIITRTDLLIRSAPAFIKVPVTDFDITVNGPSVSISALVLVPSSNLMSGAVAPNINSGASVSVPAKNFTVEAIEISNIGQLATLILAPAAAITLALHTPTISPGVVIDVPTVDYAFSPNIPIIGQWGPDIFATTRTIDGFEGGPFNIYYRRRTYVTTYQSAEMSTACGGLGSATIYGLRIFVSGAPLNQPLPGYTIGAKNTTNSVLTNNSGDTGGIFTTVREAVDETFTSSTTKEFLFDTPIAWTGNNFVFSWAWCQVPVDWDESGTNPVGGAGVSITEEIDDPGCCLITDRIDIIENDRPVIQLLYR